jgi:hypothetical protein
LAVILISKCEGQELKTNTREKEIYQIGVMNIGQNLKLCQECLGCLESHLLDGQLLQSQDKKRI